MTFPFPTFVPAVAAASGYTPLEVHFDTSTYSSNLGLTDGADLVMAYRIRRTATGNIHQLTKGFSNVEQRFNAGDSNNLRTRLEDAAGITVNTMPAVSNPLPNVNDVVSILTLVTDDVQEIWVDGVLASSDTYSYNPRDTQIIQYINTSDGAGAGTTEFDFIGGLWIGNDIGSLAYSDFFDGSDNPIFNSATIGGITATFFENGSAAAWNALSEIVGTVTDV